MEPLRSIRSCSRARTAERERGFALAMALIIAVLYFGLIELMLFDASRELAEARRFRARIVALTLAENGAELAALHIASDTFMSGKAAATDWQGSIAGTATKTDGPAGTKVFKIDGTGDAPGVVPVHATVFVQGSINGSNLAIDFTRHSQ
jgi:Tfp pilus assembly protein PilX